MNLLLWYLLQVRPKNYVHLWASRDFVVVVLVAVAVVVEKFVVDFAAGGLAAAISTSECPIQVYETFFKYRNVADQEY